MISGPVRLIPGLDMAINVDVYLQGSRGSEIRRRGLAKRRNAIVFSECKADINEPRNLRLDRPIRDSEIGLT